MIMPTAGGAALALAIGAIAAARPTLGVGFVAACLAGAVLIALPLRYFPAVVLLGLAVVPFAILEVRLGHSVLSLTPLSGQARLLVVLLLVAAARVVLERTSLPSAAPLATISAIWIGLPCFTAMIAHIRGNAFDGLESDLIRQIAYVGAGWIGFVAGASARDSERVTATYRALAKIAVGVAGACIAYWSWTVFGFPSFGSVFTDVRAVTVYDPTRSVFPFTQDSPNLAAIAFVLVGVFVVPPLASGARSDRRLALLTGLATVIAVMATQSRTGMLCLVAAAAPLVVTLPRVSRRRALAALACLGVVGVFAYSLLPADRQLSPGASTFLVRQDIWRQALAKIDAAIVVGQGYGYSAQANFIEVVPSGPYSSSKIVYQSVHSDFLGALVDGGLVGATALLALLICFMRVALAARRDSVNAQAGVGLLCALFALVVGMTASSVFQSAVNAILIWLMVGFVIGVGRRVRA
jgi:O-antigen ligase